MNNNTVLVPIQVIISVIIAMILAFCSLIEGLDFLVSVGAAIFIISIGWLFTVNVNEVNKKQDD